MPKKNPVWFLLVVSGLLLSENLAHAQRLGPTSPWLGWRPLTTRFGIHYVPAHLDPTYGDPAGMAAPGYGDSPYLLPPGARYEPNFGPFVTAPKPATGQLRVLVPTADAKVFFDGAPTSSTGLDRLYYTPPIASDAYSTYRIRAIWTIKGMENVQEQVVSVRPGETVVVDFARIPPDRPQPK
jgi:uncharacterized protein (TIGR03000 family)